MSNLMFPDPVMFCGTFRSMNNLIREKDSVSKNGKWKVKDCFVGDSKQRREKNLTARKTWRNPPKPEELTGM